MDLNDQQFAATSRGLAVAILKAAEARRLTVEDAAAIAGAALVEALGQLLGPVGALERLRDLADHLERQLINEMQ